MKLYSLPLTRMLFGLSIELLATALCGGSAHAQYTYGYHPQYGYVRTGYGGYGAYGGYGGMTAGMGAGIGAGAAMQGFGQAAAGVGQYQESHQQAEVIHQQAAAAYLQNFKDYQKEWQQNQAHIQQVQDQQVAQARAQVDAYNRHLHQLSNAHRLTSEQYDRATKVIHWPWVLRSPEFDELRYKIDQLYDSRTPQNSGTDSASYKPIADACKAMKDIVDKEVNQLGIDDFITATHFIASLEYEARFTVGSSNNSVASK